MNKKYSLYVSALLLMGPLFKTATSYAQIVGTSAYIQGTSVEVGISGAGGFEGCDTVLSPVPAGMHFRSNTGYFGFVSNPQLNSWATFDGDYFTPGTPENGWGFEIGTSGGTKGSNNCNAVNDIPGAITSWTHIGTVYSVDWEGDAVTTPTSGTDMHFKINYLLNQPDLFYTTTVEITNTSMDTIPDLYYYRNLDPDNNVSITGTYTTQNTIINQPPSLGGTGTANVRATQALPAPSTFEFLAVDTNFVAGYGGFSNRDASDLYNGTTGFTQTVGATEFADEAIYLAYHIQNFLPGTTRTLRSVSIFDSTSAACAASSLRVTQTPIAPVTIGNPAFALTGGSPAGGAYSGTGVVAGSMFDPSVSGTGDFTVIYSYTDGDGCVGNVATTVHVNSTTTGVATNHLANNISIYPNPLTDDATVSIGKSIQVINAELRIYDVLGKEVKVISNINSNEFKLDRKGLQAGMYFYKLINNKQEAAAGRIVIK